MKFYPNTLFDFVDFFFFFNDTATTEIYTLSLHDALPIFCGNAIRCLAKSPRAKSVRGESRSEEHTSELQSHSDLVCRLLLEKKKNKLIPHSIFKKQTSSFKPNSLVIRLQSD